MLGLKEPKNSSVQTFPHQLLQDLSLGCSLDVPDHLLWEGRRECKLDPALHFTAGETEAQRGSDLPSHPESVLSTLHPRLLFGLLLEGEPLPPSSHPSGDSVCLGCCWHCMQDSPSQPAPAVVPPDAPSKPRIGDFPGGPVVKTPRFHCSGCGLDP